MRRRISVGNWLPLSYFPAHAIMSARSARWGQIFELDKWTFLGESISRWDLELECFASYLIVIKNRLESIGLNLSIIWLFVVLGFSIWGSTGALNNSHEGIRTHSSILESGGLDRTSRQPRLLELVSFRVNSFGVTAKPLLSVTHAEQKVHAVGRYPTAVGRITHSQRE